MDRKRLATHLGLIFLPIFAGIIYYALIFSTKAKKALDISFGDNPADKGLFDILTNITLLFQIACLGAIVYSAYFVLARKPEEKSREVQDNLILGIAAFVATSLSLLMLPGAFAISLAVARILQTPELVYFLLSLKGELLFMIPLSALVTARYVLLYLLAILFPLSLFLCIYGQSRSYGKIMLEQTIIWTFVGDAALILLLAVSGATSLLKPVFAIPPFYAAIPAAAAVMIAPLVLLKAVEYAGKMLPASRTGVKHKQNQIPRP